MTRIPVLATLIVLLAVVTMIALGFWQLDRRTEKEALIAHYERNHAMSAAVMLPPLGPVPDAVLFRHATALCLEPRQWRTRIGRDARGKTGFRHIATCRTGVDGARFLVDMGISTDPQFKPQWTGGEVAGVVSLDPEAPSLLARLIKQPPPPLAMIIADVPAPGLMASAAPDVTRIPNNHLAYAVQWFLFAALALLIYGLALRRRRSA